MVLVIVRQHLVQISRIDIDIEYSNDSLCFSTAVQDLLLRALPTETNVESGTSQRKSETSVYLNNSGILGGIRPFVDAKRVGDRAEWPGCVVQRHAALRPEGGCESVASSALPPEPPVCAG